MEVDYYRVGKRIKDGRKAKKRTQKDLATDIGVTSAHISHIECGETKLSVQTLVDIADTLDISVDFLLEREQFCQIERIKAYEAFSDLSEQELKLVMIYAEHIKEVLRCNQNLIKDPC